MWPHLSTNIIRRRMLRLAASSSLFVALITTLVFASISHAAPGINQTINFQGRLLNAQGATVPDGYYNIQFKIYQDGTGTAAGNPSGTLEWTETYINNGSATGAIQVKNGFFAVNLGSLNAFGSQVDWNQDTLWLSMNVAGSAVACTTFGTAPCTADGEMLPMRRMTASPYALQADNANKLSGLTSSNFIQLAQGVQTDASTNTSSIFINKTSTGNLIQLQNTATDVFTVGNAGDITFGNNANHTISVTTSDAGTVGRNITVSAGTGGSGTGSVGGNLALQGGAAGGTNANGGNVTINAGAKTGTGADGDIDIGTTRATVIRIGNQNLTSGTQTIRIGANDGAGGITNVIIGAGSSATDGDTTIRSKGETRITTNGVNRATFDATGNLYLGNDMSSAAPSNFAIQSTASSTSGVAGGSLTVQGGNANTGNANGGNITIASGNKVGTGTDGNIYVGTTNLGAVQIGNTSINGAQTISIGNNATVGSTTTVTVGSTVGTSTTTIQGGSGGINMTGAVSASSTINAVSGFRFNGTSGATTTCNAGEYLQQQVVQGGITTGGTCTSITSGTNTLQDVYNNSGATPHITLGPTGDGVFIRDAASTVGGNLFAVQNNTGSTSYFAVTTTGASVAGTFSTTGLINGASISGGTLSGGNISGGTLSASTLTFGQTASTVGLTQAAASTTGGTLAIQAGQGGTGTGSAGGALTIQGGAGGGTNGGGGNVTVDSGAITGSGTRGTVNLGTTNAGTINVGTSTSVATTVQVGSTGLTSGTQSITIGGLAAAGTQNVTIGSASGAGAGTTTVQSKDTTTFVTNGTARATFASGSNTLYVGNANSSGQAATANAFTIQGTSSTGSNVQGGSVTLQAGAATSGNANGGNLNLTAGAGVGTGVTGLVVFNTPTFQTTTNDANCYTSGALVASSCTFTSASVNGSSALLAGFSVVGQIATLPDPTITTAGRVIYVTAANNSEDFTLRTNTGGGSGVEQNIAMRKNTTATMIWNGTDWTAAGASSSTTLQAAYDNTLQSAGGAELVVSKTSATNGLTIRDSSTNPVNGALLSVQSSSAANLFSINSNVTEYTSNSGAEQFVGATTFPANTWVGLGSSTIARNMTTSFVATGQGSASITTTTSANDGVKNVLTSSLTASQHYNVSFTAKLTSGTFTDMAVYYSVDGTANSVTCATGQAIKTSVWTKVNCTFTAPSAGITSNNSINIRQVGSGTARTFYVDNISVTIAADFNYATDGTVNDNTNFATNWTTSGAGSTVTRNTSDGQEASDSAQAVITSGTNTGLRNKLAIGPLTSTLYRLSTYAKLSSGTFTDFKMRYSRDGGTNFTDCVDYNTQTVTTSGWTQITCYITTDSTAASNPYIYFVQTASAARTFMIDTFSMTLASNTTPNVQIGGGVNGGPTTLFTLDKGASAPIAANNDALLGSMYYDTTLGKLQCYEADGWGACGSSPDNIVTISPEYTNAVMHGTGVGTMTSDICSDGLNLNDGSSGQPTICGANETYNFYKWTSPQPTAQTYSIYVTYQLPNTFKSFTSGSTSLMGRTDSSNSTVNYQVYRSDGTGLTACGSTVSVSTGSQSSWQTGIATGSADPSTCNFSPGNSIVFKINVTASSNANAYVGNLGFTFSNT